MKDFDRPKHVPKGFLIGGSIAWLVPLWIFEWKTAALATVVTIVVLCRKPWEKEIPAPKKARQRSHRPAPIRMKKVKGI